MIDLTPDTTVGSLTTSQRIYSTGQLSNQLDNSTIHMVSVDADGNFQTAQQVNLSVSTVGKTLYDMNMLSDDAIMYSLSSDCVDAMDGRILNCGMPETGTDAVPKRLVDSFFPNPESAGEFKIYEDVQEIGDQCNFIKWGTFRLADAFSGLGYGDAKVASITLEMHPSKNFNGIHDAYMAFFNYIDDDTEPPLSDFIAISNNKFDVSKITAQSGDNRFLKYEFDNLTLNANRVYVFKFVNSELSNRFVANESMETEYDPCGSYMLVKSALRKIHFAIIYNGTYYPNYMDCTDPKKSALNLCRRLFIHEAEINNQVIPSQVRKMPSAGFRMADVEDGKTYSVQISTDTATGEPGFAIHET